MIEGFVLLLSGAVIGWILARVDVVISENAHQIDEHIGDIQRFSDTLREYWLTTPENHDEELRLAARVRAYQAATTEFYGEAASRLSTKLHREYQVLQIRLQKIGTGGTFETNGRRFDGQRAIESYQTASKLIHLLRLARREQNGIKAFFPRVSRKR